MGTDGVKFDVSDRIHADRLNRKTVLVDTGADIAALAHSPPMYNQHPRSNFARIDIKFAGVFTNEIAQASGTMLSVPGLMAFKTLIRLSIVRCSAASANMQYVSTTAAASTTHAYRRSLHCTADSINISHPNYC
jgi:hypothetical protein